MATSVELSQRVSARCTPASPRLCRNNVRHRSTAVSAQRGDSQTSRRECLAASIALASMPAIPKRAQAAEAPDVVYDYEVFQYEKEIRLDQFKNDVTVNVNYPGLRALYEKYNSQGFNLIAFPCNQFGGQAPLSSQGEREYAYKKFGFEFPVMDKIDVNGRNAHPVYRLLKDKQPQDLPNSFMIPGEKGKITWNYTKFLVDRNGQPVARFGPSFDPLKFEGYVKSLLAGKGPLPKECIDHPGRKVCKVDLEA